jgi:hypothetical protein
MSKETQFSHGTDDIAWQLHETLKGFGLDPFHPAAYDVHAAFWTSVHMYSSIVISLLLTLVSIGALYTMFNSRKLSVQKGDGSPHAIADMWMWALGLFMFTHFISSGIVLYWPLGEYIYYLSPDLWSFLDTFYIITNPFRVFVALMWN